MPLDRVTPPDCDAAIQVLNHKFQRLVSCHWCQGFSRQGREKTELWTVRASGPAVHLNTIQQCWPLATHLLKDEHFDWLRRRGLWTRLAFQNGNTRPVVGPDAQSPLHLCGDDLTVITPNVRDSRHMSAEDQAALGRFRVPHTAGGIRRTAAYSCTRLREKTDHGFGVAEEKSWRVLVQGARASPHLHGPITSPTHNHG